MVIKKKNKGNWEYCIYLGQDENGKKKYKRKSGFKTRKACIKEASTFNSNKTVIRKTLEEVTVMYLKYKEMQGLKITSINTTKSKFNCIKFNSKFYNYYIDEINENDISDFFNSKYFLKLSSRTKLLLFSLLKSVFTFALKQKLINENIFVNIAPIKKDYSIIKIWNENDLQSYIPKLKKFKYYDIVLLALETGMRKGEILALTWDCINFFKKTILVEKNVARTTNFFDVHTPKTRASIREIVIFEDSLNMLKNRYKNRSSDFVFPSYTNPHKPMCPINLSYNFRQFLNKNNMKHIRFHDLRHIHATFLLNNKVDYKILSKRLGHTNIAFTLQTYAHVLPENEKRVLNNLPKIVY